MIQATSRLAFEAVKTTLGDRQRTVLAALGNERMTNTELANVLGWTINRVTPRTNELVQMGKVELAEKRLCRITGRKAIAWRRVQ